MATLIRNDIEAKLEGDKVIKTRTISDESSMEEFFVYFNQELASVTSLEMYLRDKDKPETIKGIEEFKKDLKKKIMEQNRGKSVEEVNKQVQDIIAYNDKKLEDEIAFLPEKKRMLKEMEQAFLEVKELLEKKKEEEVVEDKNGSM